MNILINDSVHTLHHWPAFYLYRGNLVLVGTPNEDYEHSVMDLKTGKVITTTSTLSTHGFVRVHGKLEFTQ